MFNAPNPMWLRTFCPCFCSSLSNDTAVEISPSDQRIQAIALTVLDALVAVTACAALILTCVVSLWCTVGFIIPIALSVIAAQSRSKRANIPIDQKGGRPTRHRVLTKRSLQQPSSKKFQQPSKKPVGPPQVSVARRACDTANLSAKQPSKKLENFLQVHMARTFSKTRALSFERAVRNCQRPESAQARNCQRPKVGQPLHLSNPTTDNCWLNSDLQFIDHLCKCEPEVLERLKRTYEQEADILNQEMIRLRLRLDDLYSQTDTFIKASHSQILERDPRALRQTVNQGNQELAKKQPDLAELQEKSKASGSADALELLDRQIGETNQELALYARRNVAPLTAIITQYREVLESLSKWQEGPIPELSPHAVEEVRQWMAEATSTNNAHRIRISGQEDAAEAMNIWLDLCQYKIEFAQDRFRPASRNEEGAPIVWEAQPFQAVDTTRDAMLRIDIDASLLGFADPSLLKVQYGIVVPHNAFDLLWKNWHEYVTQEGDKIKRTFKEPPEGGFVLNMKRFQQVVTHRVETGGDSKCFVAEQIKVNTPIEVPADIEICGAKYECTAIVQHIGTSPLFGHYVSFRREADENNNLVWWRTDDGSLSQKAKEITEEILRDARKQGVLYYFSRVK